MSTWLHALAPVAASAAPATANLGGTGEFLRVVLSLVAVVAMILAVGWLTRRMQVRVRPGGQRLRCVEALAVGAKERVLLLQVGDRQLLVGSSSTGLRTLLVLDEALPPPKPAAGTSGVQGFREVLERWMNSR